MKMDVPHFDQIQNQTFALVRRLKKEQADELIGPSRPSFSFTQTRPTSGSCVLQLIPPLGHFHDQCSQYSSHFGNLSASPPVNAAVSQQNKTASATEDSTRTIANAKTHRKKTTASR